MHVPCPLYGVHIKVGEEGLEPSRLAALAPKASVYAISPLAQSDYSHTLCTQLDSNQRPSP